MADRVADFPRGGARGMGGLKKLIFINFIRDIYFSCFSVEIPSQPTLARHMVYGGLYYYCRVAA